MPQVVAGAYGVVDDVEVGKAPSSVGHVERLLIPVVDLLGVQQIVDDDCGFSAGFPGPSRSKTGCLTRPYDALALLGAQDQSHVSGAVVSKPLARSAGNKGLEQIRCATAQRCL